MKKSLRADVIEKNIDIIVEKDNIGDGTLIQ